MNETSSLFWFDKPLVYSEHALLRCYQRYTPIISYLPVNAKFISSLDTGYTISYTFDFDYKGKTLRVIINNQGVVVTTFYVNPSRLQSSNKTKKQKPLVKNYDKYPYLEVADQLYDYA